MVDPTPTPNRPPLWQVMYRAYDQSKAPDDVEGWEDCHGFAAELRAIAERIEDDFATHIVGDDPVMEVVDWLRAEADRAEAGG